jgi:hypothetical protein
MQRQTVICGPTPKILLTAVPGDLRVTGWEREEISAKTKGSSLELLGDADGFTVSCDNDLILNVPDGAELTIESVGGDADLRAFSGTCQVTRVSGDLAGRGLGSFQTQGVGGNLSLRGASGGISAASVGGDVSLRAAQADILLEGVGGDLYLRGASGDISASAGGDAVLYIEPRSGADVNVNAGGDIILRLPADADARLELRGGGVDAVHVNLPGFTPDKGGWGEKIILGSGSASICLNAGGEVTVTSQADEWESAADFDFDFDMDFTDMPADLSGRIQRQVERAARQAERAQRSADAAMRRAEQKLQNAERRIQAKVNARVGRWGVDWSGSIPRPPRPPAPPSEPVSDEERLTILRMLSEKKITAQEAEKLLAALE